MSSGLLLRPNTEPFLPQGTRGPLAGLGLVFGFVFLVKRLEAITALRANMAGGDAVVVFLLGFLHANGGFLGIGPADDGAISMAASLQRGKTKQDQQGRFQSVHGDRCEGGIRHQ